MNPIEQGCKCSECPYAKDGKPIGYVTVSAPKNPVALLVADMPNSRDAEEGTFLSGPTAERFNEALAHAGLSLDECVTVYAVQCKPKEPRRNEETKAARLACAPGLAAVVTQYGHLPTLVMGSTAMAAMGKKGALTGKKAVRGFLDGNRIYTFAPAYAAWADPYSWGAFIEDVKRLGRMVRGELEPYPTTIWNADHHDLARLVKLAAVTDKRLTVDIETKPCRRDEPWTGKDPTRAKLYQIGFGTETRGISIFWDEADGDTKEMVRQVLADRAILKGLHNGPWFDLRVLARYDLPVIGWEDTRDLRRATSSTSKLSLSFLGSIATDIHAWKGADDKFDEDSVEAVDADGEAVPEGETLAPWEGEDKVEAGNYNALDCVVTSRVWRMARADMDSERKAGAPVDELYTMHKKLSVIAGKMHTRGIYVHKQWRAFMMHCLEQSIEEKKAAVRAAVGQEDFPLTPDGMRALIYKRHRKPGIRCFELPDPWDKKMYTNPDLMETIAVNENALLLLLVSGLAPPELTPIIDAWWELQGEVKRYGYLKSELFDHALGPDGRLRPGWNSCGADTMRFSCSQPNVMNIEQMLRHMLAPAPGRVIIHADKSQLELRVMACVAADMVLQDAINTGDVYSFDARGWFNLPADMDVKKLKPAARKACKIIHLGKQYGAGDQTVWAQALRQDRAFPWNQVRLLSRQFDKMYYRTVEYWREEMDRVMQCGYSEGRIIGGRRYYPMPPDRSEVANYPVQRTAAEMMNLELVELDERLSREVPGADIIIQLHDAVDVECDEKHEEQVSRIVSDVMNREWQINNLTRPFPVEMKTTRYREGGTWADV